MKRSSTLLFLMLLAQFVSGQGDKMISGRIVVNDATPQGVHVMNLVNEKEVISNAEGVFTIPAKPDDVLVFSAIHLDLMRKIIEKEDYESGSFTIKMTSKINELEEVQIGDTITAVSLGIIPKGIKTLSPAERRLYAS